jgi:hypothetical protein
MDDVPQFQQTPKSSSIDSRHLGHSHIFGSRFPVRPTEFSKENSPFIAIHRTPSRVSRQ